MSRHGIIEAIKCNLDFATKADCVECEYNCRTSYRISVPINLLSDAVEQLRLFDKEHIELVNQVQELSQMVRKLNYAHWVEEPDRERHWHCSNCGKVQGIASMAMKYCPECGASMAEHPWAGSGCGQAFSPD